MPRTMPRGIRLNNPLNIRRDNRTPWQGLADDQPDAEFWKYISPEWGIRAAARILITYRDKYRIKRLQTIINRWAPAEGERPDGSRYTQPTQAYIDHVASLTGFAPDENLDLRSYAVLRKLIPAMIRHENGMQPYSAEEIDRGLELAGVAPAKPRKLPTPEAKASAVAAGGAAAAGGASLLQEAAPAVPLLTTLADQLPMLIGGLVVAGAAWVGWTHWRRAHRTAA